MLAANLYETVSDDRRAAERPVLGREGTIRTADTPPQAVVVHDLTRDGCRISTPLRFASNDVVGIGIGGVGITLARIAWADRGVYGCAFLDPLRPGCVTAAFEASNLVALPVPQGFARQQPPADEAPRWSRAATAAFVLGGGLLGWAAIGAAALALI